MKLPRLGRAFRVAIYLPSCRDTISLDLPADATLPAVFTQVEVRTGQRMACWAVRLHAVPSSPHVLGVADRLQVGRVYAGRVPTEMVQFNPGRYLANEMGIGRTMRVPEPAPEPRPAVALEEIPEPRPALRRGLSHSSKACLEPNMVSVHVHSIMNNCTCNKVTECR